MINSAISSLPCYSKCVCSCSGCPHLHPTSSVNEGWVILHVASLLRLSLSAGIISAKKVQNVRSGPPGDLGSLQWVCYSTVGQSQPQALEPSLLGSSSHLPLKNWVNVGGYLTAPHRSATSAKSDKSNAHLRGWRPRSRESQCPRPWEGISHGGLYGLIHSLATYQHFMDVC